MENMCNCKREKEIDELKEEVKRLRDIQFNDHDILIEIKSSVGTLKDSVNQLVSKVDMLASQEGDVAKKVKLILFSVIASGIITYIASNLLGV